MSNKSKKAEVVADTYGRSVSYGTTQVGTVVINGQEVGVPISVLKAPLISKNHAKRITEMSLSSALNTGVESESDSWHKWAMNALQRIEGQENASAIVTNLGNEAHDALVSLKSKFPKRISKDGDRYPQILDVAQNMFNSQDWQNTPYSIPPNLVKSVLPGMDGAEAQEVGNIVGNYIVNAYVVPVIEHQRSIATANNVRAEDVKITWSMIKSQIALVKGR